MNAVILRAVKERQVIQFQYSGGLRTVEPHCYGVSRTGKELLRGYQTGGYSESGNSVGWKLFEVGLMQGIAVTGQTFPNDRPLYNPNDSVMAQVIANV